MYVISTWSGAEDNSAAFSSSASGSSWKRLFSTRGFYTYTAAQSPDRRIFFGTQVGILAADTSGNNFDWINDQDQNIAKIIFGPPGIVIGWQQVPTPDNAVLSTDGGSTWRTLDMPTKPWMPAVDIAIDSKGTIFAAIYNDSLYKSTDLGGSWTKIEDNATIFPWYVFTDSNDNIYALASWRITYSTDGGTTWSAPGAEIYPVNSMAVSAEGTIVAAREYDSVFVSYDKGATWEPLLALRDPGTPVHSVSFAPDGGILIGTAIGLYVIDEQKNLQKLFVNSGSGVRATSIAESDLFRFIVTTNHDGDFLCSPQTPGAGQWSRISRPFALNTPVVCTATNTADVSTYGITGNMLLKYNPLDTSWVVFSTQDSVKFGKHLIAHPNGTIYTCRKDKSSVLDRWDGVLYTTDEGATWTRVPFPGDRVFALAIDSTGRLLLSNGEHVYRTTNNGADWLTIFDGAVHHIYASHFNMLFVAGANGIWRTPDQAITWEHLPIDDAADVSGICFNEIGVLYISKRGIPGDTAAGGVYRYHGGGQPWVREISGLPDTDCSWLFETNYYQAFVSTEDGIFWQQMFVVSTDNVERAQGISLSQTYPNPVWSGNSAILAYTLPYAGDVTVKVYSMLGVEVYSAVLGSQKPGGHSLPVPTRGLVPGVYHYVLTTAGGSGMGRLVVR